MPVPKSAASCWRRAAVAETQAAEISDRHLKDVYLRIADQWSVLARCYEFADSAERFLLDAKRTKDADAQEPSSADAQQPSRESVLLPVAAREWESRAGGFGNNRSDLRWPHIRQPSDARRRSGGRDVRDPASERRSDHHR
jgi:hypothetical protein